MKHEAKGYDAVASYEQKAWVVQTVGENWLAAQGATFIEAIESLKKTLHAEAFMAETVGASTRVKSPSDVNLMWERAWYWDHRSTRNPEEDKDKRFRFCLEEEWGKGWKS